MKTGTWVGILVLSLLAEPNRGCADEGAASDMTPSVDSMQVAAAGDAMIVSWSVGGGGGMAAYGPDGTERWRNDRRADFLAADNAFVYFLAASGAEASVGLFRLRREDGAAEPFPSEGAAATAELALGSIVGANRLGRPTGMAAHDGVLAVTLASDVLAWIDGRTGRLLKAIDVPLPKFPAYGPGGELYAMLRGFPHCVEMESSRCLPIPFVSIDEVGGLAVDGAGRIVVAATSMASGVRFFSAQGDELGRFGQGRDDTPWQIPNDGGPSSAGRVAVDGEGRIWVVERPGGAWQVAVWTGDGRRVMAISPSAGESPVER